jgi:hypothetical protein
MNAIALWASCEPMDCPGGLVLQALRQAHNLFPIRNLRKLYQQPPGAAAVL